MDGYHHHYMRPPPPQPQQQPPPPLPPADPNLYHLGRPPPPPQPTSHVGPPQNTWYPNQFHYQPPPPPSHSPSPPPQQPSWAPPLPSYPPPQTFPPSHLPNQNHHFPPPHPYPYPNQEWANPSWGQHQGWDYSAGADSNAEDWAAKARAWAAAKKVEEQHPPSQYPQSIKPEEHVQFRDHHFQPGDSHYQDAQQPPFPVPGYQDYPVAAASSHQLPTAYPADPTSFSSGVPSYKADEHVSYQFGAGNSAGASATGSSVHQQEVPSSYSSVTGNYDHEEQTYNFMSLPSSTTQEEQNIRQPSPAFGKSVLPDRSFAYGGQGSGLGTDPRDQPLNFVHTHHDPAGGIRGSAPATPMPSVSSWTPNVATGTLYPPIPPVLPSVAQHDPSIPLPSTDTGNAAPPFASYSSMSSFQPTVPSAAPYTVATGTAFNLTTSFPGDAYGVSNVSDRPRKAPVPNWLKEEIIKKASAITRSTVDHPKEETKSIEDEVVDKSLVKGDQADNKSMDSTRSTEEEEDDDDEDDVEAARTVVINQEIKRVLTEVLLKVTDELFDEIATKVLNEDDPLGEVVKRRTSSKDLKTSPSPPAVLTPKAEAKILVPAKAKKVENEDGSEKSSSGSHGNLLGLANYASDEDDDNEDGETRVSSISSLKENAGPQSSNPKASDEVCMAAENGGSYVDFRKSYPGLPKSSPGMGEHDSSKVVPGASNAGGSINGGKAFNSISESQSDVAHRVNIPKKSSPLDPDNNVKILIKDSSKTRATKARSNQSDQPDDRANYAGKGSVNQTESSMTNVKEDANYRRQEDMNGSKDRVREQVDKTREMKEFDSRRTYQAEFKDDSKEEKLSRANAKEDAERNTPAKHKGDDRDRRKHASETRRHKRRRSPSESSRHRKSKDHDSSDEASDDSRREPSSRKRQSSPSSVRSRGRHASRSPNSKHSLRRHSPYSSLETTRGHKTRSRSPSRRHR